MAWRIVAGDGSPGDHWNVLAVLLACIPIDLAVMLGMWAAIEFMRWVGTR